MSAMARTKGASAEREVYHLLNACVVQVMKNMGRFSPKDIELASRGIQRNQNQTAVGGSDLSGTFGLSIEIKRQETLSLNEWWQQATRQADNEKGIPVLIYRQNRKPWRVRMNLYAHVANGSLVKMLGDVSIDDFLVFFIDHVEQALLNE